MEKRNLARFMGEYTHINKNTDIENYIYSISISSEESSIKSACGLLSIS